MFKSFARWLAVLLGFGICQTGRSLGQEKVRDKTPFQETAEAIQHGCIMPLVEFWHFPHFTSWGRFRQLWGEKVDAEYQKQFQRFPDELMKALADREGEDHEKAVEFLAFCVSMTRSHAVQLSEKNLSLAVDRSLAPYTDRIRKALEESLQSKPSKARMLAALILLSLDVRHNRANEVLLATAESADLKLVEETSLYLGLAHVSSPHAMECLRRMLKHRDKRVRNEAANAIIKIGPAAKDLVPDLIAFLRTGKEAEGTYSIPFVIAPPQSGNLALIALVSMKEHAAPAVPALIEHFPTANEEEKLTILACLTNIGCKDDACLKLARESLKNEKAKLQMAAACTLLHLSPGDREATERLKEELAAEAFQKVAMEICERFGPPSREIAVCLIPMLDDKEEAVRISAMHALGRIGPLASEAVPGIERLLAIEENGMTHTFQSSRSAAQALSMIRGKEAAAALLRIAGTKSGSAMYALMYLPELGDDLPPTALNELLRIIENKNQLRNIAAMAISYLTGLGDDTPPYDFADLLKQAENNQLRSIAAMALSNMGERARPVRRDIERLLDDPEVGWILDTALHRIPQSEVDSSLCVTPPSPQRRHGRFPILSKLRYGPTR